jgi:predicted amidophosphoribosyltransferase
VGENTRFYPGEEKNDPALARTEVLQRRRETRTQTALTPEGRHANVAGAFEARGAAGLACVLVDDVFTTGATLAAAGAALQGAGAARVEAVTFARAEPPVSLG